MLNGDLACILMSFNQVESKKWAIVWYNFKILNLFEYLNPDFSIQISNPGTIREIYSEVVAPKPPKFKEFTL